MYVCVLGVCVCFWFCNMVLCVISGLAANSLGLPDFDGFLLFWNVKKIKLELMVNVKMATFSAKFVPKNA